MKLFILALSLAALVVADSTCVFTAGGKTFDLTALKKNTGEAWDTIYSTGTDSWHFYFQPCGGNLDSTFTGKFQDCTDKAQLPAACIQIDRYGQCKRVAAATPADTFTTLTTEGNLNLTYGGGAYCMGAAHNRQIHIVLTCNQVAGEPTIREDPAGSCFYTVDWAHPAGCVVPSGGMSFGWIMIIIMLVCFVLYIVGGMAFMKFKKGATGKEIIPNSAFWFGLPGLCWDGMKFLFHLCTFCCRKQGYSSLA
ncbi:hypothetical protein PAPYR_4120 [Paratrimastix pyriformis]|uniref:Autophagy-related protein 27 n=1 Tax=Paratrimastix pyriformis TaxID=342808 RepID=A0ABQ8UKJ7_9EUKA|nr:hypothetical protein PAPYR_4120 [Paratrimastix pyriformis]